MKKTLKRSLSLLLAATIIFSSASVGLSELDFSGLFAVWAEAASVDDLTFTINYDGTSYSVTDCDTSASGEIVIPSTYNDLPVTSVGDSAFYYCDELTSITIPDSVTEIGEKAFCYARSLQTVILSENLSVIPYRAFYDCDGLTEIDLPSEITEIGAEAFAHSSNLTSIVIPDSVTTIGESAFYYCDSLESAVLSKNLTEISKSLFSYCDLSEIELFEGITSIEAEAFRDNEFESIEIPDTVVSIGEKAFYDCDYLKEVYFPENLEIIGERAFADTRVSVINLPASVTSIGAGAFSGYAALTEITLDEENQYYTVEDNVLFDKNKTKLLIFADSESEVYTVPDTVVTIEAEAFEGHENLLKVYLPEGLEIIGTSAFSECENLKEINIPSTVKSIGNSVFSWCDSLKKLIIPDGITHLSDYLLVGCDKLEELTIPASVTSMGVGIFQVDNLKYVYYTGTKAQWDAIEISSYDNYGLDYAQLIILCDHDKGNTIEKDAIPAQCMVDGHTAGVFCNDCENWVTGEVIPKTLHTDEEKDNICDTCSEQYSEIFLDKPLTVNLDEDESVYIKFTAFDSGIYSFTTTSATEDYYIAIKDSNKKELDSTEGWENEQQCQVELIEGNVYYLYVYSWDLENSYELTLTCSQMYCKHPSTTSYDAVEHTCESEGYTAGVFCEECETWISGHVTIPRHTDENEDGFCDVCLFGISDIYAGQTKTLEIEDTETVFLKVVPSQSGKYTFTGYDTNGEMYGSLYDSDMNLLEDCRHYSDDDDDIWYFRIKCELEKGETYYFSTTYEKDYYNSPDVKKVDTTLTLDEVYCDHDEVIEVPEKAPECTVGGNTAGTKCVFCGKMLTGTEIPATGHTDDDSDALCDVCGEPASDIFVDVPLKVNVEDYVYIKFIPSLSGIYIYCGCRGL